MGKIKKRYGVIKYKNINFHYYVYGHRGGRGLAVYKEYLDNENRPKQFNKIMQTFSWWHFDAKLEANKIIVNNFKLLNKPLK